MPQIKNIARSATIDTAKRQRSCKRCRATKSIDAGSDHLVVHEAQRDFYYCQRHAIEILDTAIIHCQTLKKQLEAAAI